jgi:N-acetylglutamate synthase-like GNAT family acetyltransferase
MQADDLTIRTAGPDDAHAIVAIYVAAWRAGFGSRMPAIEVGEERVTRWRLDLDDTTPTRWWLANRDATTVGFVGIGPCRDPVEGGLGELDTIAVAPDAWRTGVGSILMAVALDGLREAGFRRATLWTLSDYPMGESFYAAHGWRRTRARRDRGNQVRFDHDLVPRAPAA